MSGPYSFMFRLILVFVVIVVLVVIGRFLVLPESWGEHGYYRGAAMAEEASRPMVYGTNDSCKSCHEEIYDLKKEGTHKRLSCEICHAPVGEHVKGKEKIADMRVKSGEQQLELCMECHRTVVGRPTKFPMIDKEQHYRELKIKSTHTCDQCHTVHSPYENMQHLKRFKTLKEEVGYAN